jgi:hypothetical protein
MMPAPATPSRRSAAPRRARPIAFACAVLLMSAVAGAGVAELTVTAYGAQRFDLATGFTELPDGGEVVDQGTGVRLQAPWLRYAEGDLLEARDATVDGPFGRLTAPFVSVDLRVGRLEATGGVALENAAGHVLRADEIVFDAEAGWAEARGGVTGEAPTLAADVVWAHIDSGRLVLAAPYLYEDGPISLRSDGPGAWLQLTPVRDADEVIVDYDATTTLDEDVAQRVESEVE